MRSTFLRFGSLLAILVLVLAACGTQGQSQAPAGSEPATDEPAGEVAEIRWFCCLGAGDDPAQVEVEQATVDAFNESHPDIHVTLEVVEYEEAYDILAVQL